ncbi:MAG TPA: CHAT domain-containing tetratricopeptide repeat protein [Cyclobacteriaceae bacterium]|nr:CHAT domain-containing tetratricopeptide repeat protein [Cyclobacteriaceae bacterium]
MAQINPGVLRKRFLCLILFFLSQSVCAQEIREPVVRFSHPVLNEINALVDSRQYMKAIGQSLKAAQAMKKESNWEGYMAFMLRAAEIETFEVWKTKSDPKTEIRPDYRRALTYLDSLYKNGKKYIGDYPYIEADALFTSAVVYDWLHRSDTAEQMHRSALNLRLKLYGKNSREVADSYLWMGAMYKFNLNRKVWAKNYYKQALDLQKKYLPDSRYALGSVYYGLSSLARENFEFDEAIALINQYSSLYEDLPYEQAYAHQLIANIYMIQNEYEKSLNQRMEAIRIYEQSGFTDELVLAYSNLSDNLKELHRYRQAMETLMEGEKILSKSKTKNFLDEQSLYQNLGDLYRIIGQYDSAKIYFDKSLQLVSDHLGKKNERIANVYELRGRLYADQGKFKEGLNDYQQMLASVIPDFRPADIFTIPKIEKESPFFMTIITAQFNKGDALLAWYEREKNPVHLEQALGQYKSAFAQLIEARKTIGDELSKPFLMDNFQRSIEKSIQCAKGLFELTHNKHYYQDIFHFVELTKYLNVLDALQRAERANNSNVPKSLLFELDDVKSELHDLQKEKLESGEDSLAQINDRILTLIGRRRELTSEISKYPDYASSSLDSMLLDVNEIQQKLSSGNQILEYFWGTDSIYVLSLTNKSMAISSVPYSADIDGLFTSVYHHMSGNQPFNKDLINRFSKESSTIYKMFIAPFMLKSKLIIIPDGPLRTISVDALVVNYDPKADTTYGGLDYAILHSEISYAYSASILFKNRLFKNKEIENVLAFSYSNGTGGPIVARRNQPGELPGTYKELEALSRLFKNVKRFTDLDATKVNFINNTTGIDIIHLGVHGIGDEEVADNSRLIFRRDSLNDSELFAYEIYNLNLSAGLVVLSACESGLGRNQRGEGIFSIARAFTYAGCPAAVMSLWQARDSFTSEIMVKFYENLNKQESVSYSLRDAKLQFLKESDNRAAHPANWAAFVLNGQDLKFSEESSVRSWIFIMGAITLLTAIALYARKRIQT